MNAISLDLSAPPSRQERAMNRRIEWELAAADKFRVMTEAYRSAVETIPSDLLWVPGYDRTDILAILSGWQAYDPASVRRHVLDHSNGEAVL